MPASLAKVLAVALSALAGFVDAIGYLALGRLFVAFMSGNSTVLGISVAGGSRESGLAAGLVAAFVAGVMAGTWVGRPFGARRAAAVLLLVAVVLAAAAGLAWHGLTVAACLTVALAMGAENTVFQQAHGPPVGLTYMTGTLVRVGQRLAEGFVGGAWSLAVPDLVLWLGMVCGAGLGAVAYRALHMESLWVAAATAFVLAGGGVGWRGVDRRGARPRHGAAFRRETLTGSFAFARWDGWRTSTPKPCWMSGTGPTRCSASARRVTRRSASCRGSSR